MWIHLKLKKYREFNERVGFSLQNSIRDPLPARQGDA